MIVVEVISLILLVLLIIIAIFCMSFGNVKLKVDGRVINAQMELCVGITLCGIHLGTLRWPDSHTVQTSSMVHWVIHFMRWHKIAGESEKKASYQMIKSIDRVMHYESLQKELKKLSIKSLSVSHVYWYTNFGLGEADQTALAVGWLWALKSNLLSIINHVLQGKMTRPILQVRPDYAEKPGFRTHFKCMIHFRIGHAISKAFQIVKYRKRR